MRNKNQSSELVSQQHPMGCAVACVAALCGISYRQAIDFFETPEHAWTRGFYCSEIVRALAEAGLEYTYSEFSSSKHSRKIKSAGTIVFVAPCEKYPAGHFLLRQSKGWMNPWSNYPWMDRVHPALEKELPGQVSYLVYAKARH